MRIAVCLLFFFYSFQVMAQSKQFVEFIGWSDKKIELQTISNRTRQSSCTFVMSSDSIRAFVFTGQQLQLMRQFGLPRKAHERLLGGFMRDSSVYIFTEQAERGVAGRMEGHAEMDMSVSKGGSLWQRITSPEGFTAISHYFVMDWASVWLDIVGGLVIAGVLAAWVPHEFWQAFFLVNHPTVAKFWGPIVGPLVAVIAFVCSVGNIPLAAVLWNGGISFGGVIAFIFADLIVLPVLNIYRKYYGLKVAAFLFATFYVSMAAAALVVEGIFSATGLIPCEHKARVVEASITWNYATWLNIVFLGIAALLLWRFFKTGGPEMLRMMNRPAEPRHAH